jgi:short-subunit dehydrogenase
MSQNTEGAASLAGLQSAATTDRNRLQMGDRLPADHAWAYGYIATKAAVIGISEMLSAELSGTRVGVSVLLPGAHRSGALFENSARFRPQQYGGAVDPAIAAAAMGRPGVVTQNDAPGAELETRDPAELAARVVRAVRERQFYIFTHPANRAAIARRFNGIMAGFDDADSFTA